MSNPCIAVSAEADFEAGTWTFEPILPDFAVGAGRYAIIRETTFVALEQQRDELLAAAKNLIAVKGRFHSEQAFNALVDVVAQVEEAP